MRSSALRYSALTSKVQAHFAACRRSLRSFSPCFAHRALPKRPVRQGVGKPKIIKILGKYWVYRGNYWVFDHLMWQLLGERLLLFGLADSKIIWVGRKTR